MRKIEFLKEPITYFNENEYVAYISRVEGEDKLFDELRELLKFPDYFGDNWNALSDCLRDFSWIDKKGIVLVHLEIPKLSEVKLRTYIEVLFDSVQYWKEGEEHYLKVIFPEETEQSIKEILNFQ